MSKREFMMLAQEYLPKHDISGWWMSTKLDGQRAFWDGAVSRGLDAREVPYANVAKDARLKERPISTGLFSRYGKVIYAPDWWLNGLPVGPTLDMELWMGNGTFQALRSTVGSHTPGPGWKDVKGIALDSPGWHAILASGEINNANWQTFLDPSMLEWVKDRSVDLITRCPPNLSTGLILPWTGLGQPDECFGPTGLASIHKSQIAEALRAGGTSPTWQPHDQLKLPKELNDARSAVDDMLLLVTSQGGEGLILRSPTSPWLAKRVPWVLKVKKLNDAEGTVVGMTWGRRTDKGSRHLGRMGALILRLKNGKRMELSGFTDEERSIKQKRTDDKDHKLDWVHVDEEAGRKLVPCESITNEGKDASDAWEPLHFPIGSQITFTYRDLTVDGIPKEGRFLRRRTAE